MNILFEINHPGQVHLLKNTIQELGRRGYEFAVITKNDQAINYLLDVYGIPYITLGEKGTGISGKLIKQLIFDFKAYQIAIKGNYKIGFGSSITNDHISIFKNFDAIHLSDDDENIVPLIRRFSYPFSKVILSPDCLKFSKYDFKNIGYAGYHELAYLHPNRFLPDPGVIKEIGIGPTDQFFILRFVALKGHHDYGHLGISYEQKKRLIDLLKPHGRIFITSEKDIEPEFEGYRLPVAPENIHSLMYYAALFLGDSQTMTSEAAILGTPALKCNTFAGKLSVPNELEEKYGLCYSYQPSQFEEYFNHARKLLNMQSLKEAWKVKKDRLLNDKIDVTSFFIWFIENYPQSFQIMKQNPDYQYNFK